jgi:hypothetical protein
LAIQSFSISMSTSFGWPFRGSRLLEIPGLIHGRFKVAHLSPFYLTAEAGSTGHCPVSHPFKAVFWKNLESDPRVNNSVGC